eukprot:TRINITY_DN12485_c0_g1_i1.p1 TRINITY_DN12485_c0_g1~~TRINITY_DN12485_c0_g1_i1.p1  ORF type:complete len:143 (+),score=38.55 TRINITY_DN12485_c0_g1_i1:39-467(+)
MSNKNIRRSELNIHKSATLELRDYTLEEVSKHNKEGDAWVIINGKVFDVSKFDHPGGMDLLKPYYGTDTTRAFLFNHTLELLDQISDNHSVYLIGDYIREEKPLRPFFKVVLVGVLVGFSAYFGSYLYKKYFTQGGEDKIKD